MAGVAALGLAAAVLGIVQFGWQVQQELNAFRSSTTEEMGSLADISVQLPFLLEALDQTHQGLIAGDLEHGSQSIVQTVVEGCQKHLDKLDRILKATRKEAGDNVAVLTVKAFKLVRYKDRLVLIKESVNNYVALLILHHVMPHTQKIPMTESDAKARLTKTNELRQRFVYACSKGDVASLPQLFAEGADPDSRDDGWPVLCRAACSGIDAIVGALLAKGADPTAQSQKDRFGKNCGLWWAANEGHGSTVKLLLEIPDEHEVYSSHHYYSALEAAVEHSGRTDERCEIVKMLVEPGRADLKFNWKRDDFDSPLAWRAVYGEHFEIVKLLLELGVDFNEAREGSEPPLIRAIDQRSPDIVALLLTANLDLEAKDEYHRTALMVAAATSQAEILRALLSKGASPHTQNDDGQSGDGPRGMVTLLAKDRKSLNIANQEGVTPLMRAITKGLMSNARTLLKAKAAADLADNKGMTALHCAAQVGSVEAVQLLFERGQAANFIDAEDHQGNTPLSLAAAGGHEAVVLCLLKHGADRNIENEFGDEPSDCAKDSGHSEIVDMLKDFKL
ncbi:B-cell lymphoma 3 protein [Friedmanniomyces endolithicus]|nr:B-cell lymphoma 3 protein [Friedmanniomyces endolithicus]